MKKETISLQLSQHEANCVYDRLMSAPYRHFGICDVDELTNRLKKSIIEKFESF